MRLRVGGECAKTVTAPLDNVNARIYRPADAIIFA